MTKNEAVRTFIKAVLTFRRSQGQNVIPRAAIFEALNREDPRQEYGSNPIGADLTADLMNEIATDLGGQYVKDPNGKNARFVF